MAGSVCCYLRGNFTGCTAADTIKNSRKAAMFIGQEAILVAVGMAFTSNSVACKCERCESRGMAPIVLWLRRLVLRCDIGVDCSLQGSLLHSLPFGGGKPADLMRCIVCKYSRYEG